MLSQKHRNRLMRLLLGVLLLGGADIVYSGDITVSGKLEFQAKPTKKPAKNLMLDLKGSCITNGSATTDASGDYSITVPCTGAGCAITLEFQGLPLARFTVSQAACTSGGTATVNRCISACPCSASGPGAVETVIYCKEYKKAGAVFGTMIYKCTNQSDFGDFVRTWTPAGGDAKAIAKCVFEGGINRVSYREAADEKGNVKQIIHRCYDGGDPDGADWDLVIYAFDTKVCKLLRICSKRVSTDPDVYIEQSRKCTTAADYADFGSLEDGVDDLTVGLYDPLPNDLKALDDGGITLIASLENGKHMISWMILDEQPKLEPDDYVLISDLSVSDLIFCDPGFVAEDTPEGLLLTATTVVAPDVSDILLEYVPPYQAPHPPSDYVIINLAASAYWDSIFGGALLNEERYDRLDSASGAGQIDLAVSAPGIAIPTVSEWGLLILMLLILTAGTLVLGRRRHTVSGPSIKGW